MYDYIFPFNWMPPLSWMPGASAPFAPLSARHCKFRGNLWCHNCHQASPSRRFAPLAEFSVKGADWIAHKGLLMYPSPAGHVTTPS